MSIPSSRKHACWETSGDRPNIRTIPQATLVFMMLGNLGFSAHALNWVTQTSLAVLGLMILLPWMMIMPNKPGDMTRQPTIAATNAHSRMIGNSCSYGSQLEADEWSILIPNVLWYPMFTCGIYPCVYSYMLISFHVLAQTVGAPRIKPLMWEPIVWHQWFANSFKKRVLGTICLPNLFVLDSQMCIVLSHDWKKNQCWARKKSLEHALSRLAPQLVMLEARSYRHYVAEPSAYTRHKCIKSKILLSLLKTVQENPNGLLTSQPWDRWNSTRSGWISVVQIATVIAN